MASQATLAISSPVDNSEAARFTIPSDRRPIQWGIKMLVDRLLAAALILFLLPSILCLFILVMASDWGSPIFAHSRVGRRGKQFYCLKVRSMRLNSAAILAELLLQDPVAAREWEESRKLRNDPRILRFGRFIRATSLDELPQLFNIVKGEMSFVGPRPVISDELPYYGNAAGHYLAVTPGLTGLWQVSGRSDLSYGDRVALDVAYVENWSLLQDLRILFTTPRAVLAMAGAC